MNKEEIEKRIEELKKENDLDNEKLNQINQLNQQTIQGIFVRNGRILELEKMKKEMGEI